MHDHPHPYRGTPRGRPPPGRRRSGATGPPARRHGGGSASVGGNRRGRAGGRGVAVAERPYVDTDRSAVASDDTLVLDIGGDVGALVLYTAEDVLGAEIEVSPDVDGAHRVHTLIRRRRIGGHELFAGVYPELREGTWRIFGLDEEVIGTVSIRGGHVAEFQGHSCRKA